MRENQHLQLQIRSVQSEMMEIDARVAELSAVDAAAPRLIQRLEQVADQLRTSLPGS